MLVNIRNYSEYSQSILVYLHIEYVSSQGSICERTRVKYMNYIEIHKQKIKYKSATLGGTPSLEVLKYLWMYTITTIWKYLHKIRTEKEADGKLKYFVHQFTVHYGRRNESKIVD